VIWYQGGLKPERPKDYVDVGRMGNGAIFEGTKGAIVADFTSRLIIPNNDDGDLTYYRRRSKQDLLPLIQRTGWATQPASRARLVEQKGPGLSGFTVGPSGFPEIEMLSGNIPPALGLPNPVVDAIVEAERSGKGPAAIAGEGLFQLEWTNACKGNSNSVMHGTSSKTHCDFDYAGTMMEQLLLGLVAHRAGKKLEYDPATGRVTNAQEANDYLKRQYRSGWSLNG
jgi:hypothetical protein